MSITDRPPCPHCNSQRVWKDGLRYTRDEEVQRYICRDCGYRFSETSIENPESLHTNRSYRSSALSSTRQVCVAWSEGTKNLAEVETRQKRAAGATKLSEANTKGQMVEFIWELKKQGLEDSTIKVYRRYLERLNKLGANLLDPDSVKETIARQKWSQNTRALAVNAYNKFLEIVGGTWEPPRHRSVRKLPFIPLESELDQLISGSNKKRATFLQLLKETGMRSGEAWSLEWTDVDFKRETVTLNEPEKHGKPRMFKISGKLLAMLKALPRNSDSIFEGSLHTYRRSYRKFRKRIAHKLQNPRLKKITFHTFRHWKATMEYHRTKDILHVKELLGHRDIKTTLIYTQLVSFERDDYHSATAKTTEEAEELVGAGFEYVCTTPQDVMLFRKRK